jgi:hypothetical protein
MQTATVFAEEVHPMRVRFSCQSKVAPVALLGSLLLGGCAHHATARALEAKSEALHNACVAADWGYARQLVDEAREDWSSIESSAAREGASPALIGMVSGALPLANDAVDRHARRACVSDANGLSLAAAALDESHEARVRAWLRRVQIDGEYRDFDAAARDVDRTEGAWPSVRQGLVPHAAEEVDAALAACHGAVDARDALALMHASHAALDAIDSANRR